MFNGFFGFNLPESTVISTIYRYGLKNGRDTRLNKGWEPTQFKKGCTPHNKGKKKYWVGGEATQFKKGHIPKNYRPVGSERVNPEGYVEVKVSDPNKWKMKHVVVWESANGPVPKGFVIIFADANRGNFSAENLILVSRQQLLEINRKHLIFDDPKFTRTGLLIAELNCKIRKKLN